MDPLPGTTDPRLLSKLADWDADAAWREFFRRYDPLVTSWCRRAGLAPEAADELGQRVWFELSWRMRSFRYDTGRTFRGWLWRLVRSRAVDMARERRGEPVLPLDEGAGLPAGRLAIGPPGGDGGPPDGPDRLALLGEAREAQEAVRRQVEPETWLAFWMVEIEGRSVKEVADLLGKNYAAVFQAHRRVCRRLRDEGERRLGRLRAGGPATEHAPSSAEGRPRGRGGRP